jgi:hypothetical protein
VRAVTALSLAAWCGACAAGGAGPGAEGGAVPGGTEAVQATCGLEGMPLETIDVADSEASEWHVRFELPDKAWLWAPVEADQEIAEFRKAVAARLGADPDARSLLERQRAIYAAMPPEWRGEATNGTLVLEGGVGSIGPVGCLEAMLWKWQAARYPMIEHPTEFGAFVLVGDGVVSVYLSGADLVGQRIRGTVMERVAADLRSGYRLRAHVHNHPFLFDREVGDRMWTVDGTREDVAGALAPSMTDVQFYRSLRDHHNLEEAWVTNGLETARFRAAELDLLTAHADPPDAGGSAEPEAADAGRYMERSEERFHCARGVLGEGLSLRSRE